MAQFADGKIEAYVGPRELGAADDLEELIVGFIAAAKSSLSVAVQELDNEAIAQALLDASWRGVRVELFLEQDYLRTPLPGSPPKQPKALAGETPEQALRRVQWLEDDTELAPNRRILSALLRSDVQVSNFGGRQTGEKGECRSIVREMSAAESWHEGRFIPRRQREIDARAVSSQDLAATGHPRTSAWRD